MTEYTPDDRGTERPTKKKETMGGVSHTNPVTGKPFGESQVYARGRFVVADGGEADTADEADDENETGDRVKDVDHTPREGAPDASRVYERGGEGQLDEDVVEEENGDRAGAVREAVGK